MSGSAKVPHWPTVIQGETLTKYTNNTNDQPSHHSPDDEGTVSETLDFFPQLTQLVAQKDFIDVNNGLSLD